MLFILYYTRNSKIKVFIPPQILYIYQIKKYRNDLQEARTKTMKLDDAFLEKKNKQNLLGTRNEVIFLKNKEIYLIFTQDTIKKDRLISNTEKILNQTEQFLNMNQAANQTKDVAITITSNLKYQRDLLLNAETSVFFYQ